MSSHIQPILGPVARDRDGKVTNVANHAEDTTFPEKGDEGVGFLWLPYERSQLGWLKNYTYSLTVGRPESETKVSAGLGALQRHGGPSVRPRPFLLPAAPGCCSAYGRLTSISASVST